MRDKIAIIGAGQVGATTAELCGLYELGDVVLIDIAESLAEGKALDIQQSMAILQREPAITGTGDFSNLAGSKIVVITAGFPRKPGMSREELVKSNGQIVRGIAEKIAQFAPEAIVINVTNPMDVMTYLVHKTSQLSGKQILGMGGILDSGRFAAMISRALNISPDQIFALVIGMHGENMVPLPFHSTVYGQPLSKLLSKEVINSLVEQTINGGARIVELLKTGSAYFAPAAAIVEMISCILHDKNRILPVAAYLQGEYGHKDIFAGVPARLGYDGLQEIIELDLTEAEKARFDKSVDSIRNMIPKIIF